MYKAHKAQECMQHFIGTFSFAHALGLILCCREALDVAGREGPCWGAGADNERSLHVAVADGGMLPQGQDCHGAAGELSFAWSVDSTALLAFALCCY